MEGIDMAKVKKRATLKKANSKIKRTAARRPRSHRGARSKVAKKVKRIKRVPQTKKSRRKAKARVSSEEEAAQRLTVNTVIDGIINNELATEYLRKNVSKKATDVISALTEPKTDEQLAAELGIKINAVRRILNIMHGYGITNYNISKDSKGWLSFLWFINTNKIDQFYDYISKKNSMMNIIDENCNDYFICKECFNENKLIFNFDSSFEVGFKCVLCGNKLERISKEEALGLLGH
jgi:transcription factor E